MQPRSATIGQRPSQGVAPIRDAFGPSFNAFLYISLRHRYVYVQTPKVASTTLKGRLIDLEIAGSGIERRTVPQHPDVLRSVHVKPYQLPPRMLRAALCGSGFVRFCFVRNPYARVLSAYLDKICNFEPEGVHFRRAQGLADEAELSFDDFVRRLHKGRAKRTAWDPHWRPQTALLRPDLIEYALIGKLERFDADFRRLDDLLGNRLRTYRLKSPHATGAARKVQDHYRARTRKYVEQIYTEDFAAFDYARDPGDL